MDLPFENVLCVQTRLQRSAGPLSPRSKYGLPHHTMSLMVSGLRLNQVAEVFPAAFGSSTSFSALGSLVATKELFDGSDDSSESQSVLSCP